MLRQVKTEDDDRRAVEVPGQFRARGSTGLRPHSGDTVNLVRPFVPPIANKQGVAQIAPRAIRPRCTPRGRGRAASEIRCPRELDVLPRYAQSR